MNDFLRRLQQRKIVQWALAYLAGAFALIQVLDVVGQRFGWPAQVMRFVIVAGGIGLPVAIVVAWYHGERGVQRVSRSEVLVLALLVVAGLGLMWQFRIDAAGETRVGARPTPEKSIAVLPFADLSPAHDQEYFSDGIAEEILNALMRVKGLKVAGRTSSFHYKGRNEDLRGIGQALGVAHVLEGSVRTQGDRVRIAAQLIRSDDGFNLWSDEFDGQLADVFELQERIARAITGRLEVILQGRETQRLVSAATANPAAHALYLQASAAFNQRDYARMGEAIGWLEEALRLDPGFARAHSRLAMIHTLGHEQYGASRAEGERQARLALALDPGLAEPHAALGILAWLQRRYLESRTELEQAVEIEPDNAIVNLPYAQNLIVTGYTRQGIARLERTLAIDPMLPNALKWRAREYAFNGEADLAERLFRRAADLGLAQLPAEAAEIAHVRGDDAAAATLAGAGREGADDVYRCLKTPASALPVLYSGIYGGDAAARSAALEVIGECLAAKPAVTPAWLAGGLLMLGQPDQAMDVMERGNADDEAYLFARFWSPAGLGARRSPRFAAFARAIGMADLWDRYGPPDGCHRVAARDYACD